MKKRALIIAVIGTLLTTVHWCHAQSQNKTTTVHFADAVKGEVKHKYIMEHATLKAERQGCTISGFQVSFVPSGGNLFGPFRNKGNKLTENQMNFLREFTEKKVKIYIEDITVSCGSDTTHANHIAITSIP